MAGRRRDLRLERREAIARRLRDGPAEQSIDLGIGETGPGKNPFDRIHLQRPEQVAQLEVAPHEGQFR